MDFSSYLESNNLFCTGIFKSIDFENQYQQENALFFLFKTLKNSIVSSFSRRIFKAYQQNLWNLNYLLRVLKRQKVESQLSCFKKFWMSLLNIYIILKAFGSLLIYAQLHREIEWPYIVHKILISTLIPELSTFVFCNRNLDKGTKVHFWDILYIKQICFYKKFITIIYAFLRQPSYIFGNMQQ